MSELNDFISVINGHIDYFGLKKRKLKSWAPKDKKDIDDFLEDFFKTYPDAKKIKTEIVTWFEKTFATTMENDITLRAEAKDRDHIPWFNDETKKIWENKIYTNSQYAFYKKNLEAKLGKTVSNDIDISTNEILEDLEKPSRPGSWETKGMVVGDVQSGKTSNYNALIAKAIDSGYKMIIVMSGIYNSLRAQTQTRLMENLISTSDPRKGDDVFAVNFMTNKPYYKFPNGIKTMETNGDFNAKTAKTVALLPNLDPAIFVIKKNVPVLSNILVWLNSQPGIKYDPKVPWTWNGFKEYVSVNLPKNKIECDLPLLIIDDECDSASIDISKRKTALSTIDDPEELEAFRLADPSKTNLLIRRIMACFKRNAYIGYTATPLANIFIDYTSIKKQEGRDLFPRDFVKLLKRYDSYQSPRKIFGKAEQNFDDDNEIVSLSEDIDQNDYPQIKWVYDYRDDFDEFIDSETGEINEEKRDEVYRNEGKRGYDEPKGWVPLYHKQHHPCQFKDEDRIPPSLEDAIITFLINIGIKYLRSDEIQHNSMLIHISRFVSVQNTVIKQIKSYVKDLKNVISNEIDKEKIEIIKSKFLKIWNEDISKNLDNTKNKESKELKFEDVWKNLVREITDEEKFDVIQINSNSTDILDYESKKRGWNVIVIGGAAISRGITLEGLSVSYFLRIAKTPVSDTLTQMGRWFGYRQGYEDLYRIYVPKILHILFRQFTYAMEFAREKFREMQTSKPPKTPIEFSMEIPTFEGWNLIAASKSKDLVELPEPLYSYSSRHHQNIVFHKDKTSRETNIDLLHNLIDKCGKYSETENEINKRFKDANIWLPKKIKEKIDPNLEKEQIIKEIPKDFKRSITKGHLWKDINPDEIVKFLLKFKMPRRAFTDSHPHDIAFRIRDLKKHRPIVKWNFAVWSLGEGDKLDFTIGKKNKINIKLAERGLTKPSQKKYFQNNEFSIGVQSDPRAEFMDIDKTTFDEGLDNWINMYKATGKTEEKKDNHLPYGFKSKIRQKRKEGIFILTPWLIRPDGINIKQDKDSKLRLEEDLHVGWEIIIPPTKEEGDNDNLVYNVALNRVALEHRKQNLLDFLNIEKEEDAA